MENSMVTKIFARRSLAAMGAALVVIGLAGGQTRASTETVAGAHHPDFILTAAETALRDALSGGDLATTDIADFYERRGYAAIWADKPALVEDLRRFIATAAEHALPVAKYDLKVLDRLAQAGSFADRAAADIEATRLYLNFARDLNSGMLKPSEIDPEITHKRRIKRADALLQHVALGIDPEAFFAGLVPADPGYGRLLEEKKRLQAIVEAGGWGAKVPTGGVLRPGRKYRSVPILRARLTAMGYGDMGTSRLYDDTLLMIVKLFQARHGLNADGVAGPATLAAVNTTAQTRLEQVIVNLERMRWLNFDRGARHIFVNLADYTVDVMDNGVSSFSSRVVIGKTGRDFRTPEFAHEMTHMVINPYWHVPKSIARREYLPLLKEDNMALAKRGLQLLNRRGQILDTSNGDFSGYSESNFPFNIKQPPGSRNALGRVKFMFPNRHNIYLHDTPAKRLFAKERRAYSHGCVRVQRPFDLAYHLLAQQMDRPESFFQSILKTRREKFVNLDQPVPIYLSYHSAFVDDNGVPQYRGDIYRRDGKILAALKAAGVQAMSLGG